MSRRVKKETPAELPEILRPRDRSEMVVEVLRPADDKGKTTFFAYWLADHPETGEERVRGQVFKTSLEEFRLRCEAGRFKLRIADTQRV